MPYRSDARGESEMKRTLAATLLMVAMAIAALGMACADTQTAIDNDDEGYGAT